MINNFLRNAIGLAENEWKTTLDDEMDEVIEDNIEAFKNLAE